MPRGDKQARVDKEGYTPAHDKLIEYYVAYGLKKEWRPLLNDTKTVSNAVGFPANIRNYSNDRKTNHIQRKRRGTNWSDPEFDGRIYAIFRPNTIIQSFADRASGISAIPSNEPRAYDKMPPRRKKQNEEDESVDMSFNGNAEGDDDDGVNELTNRFENAVGFTTTPPRHAKRAADLLTAFMQRGCLPTNISSRADMNPFGMQVLLHGLRPADDGSYSAPWMQVRLLLHSVMDYPFFDLSINFELDKKARRKSSDGASVITLTCPRASYACVNNHKHLAGGPHLNDKKANAGNKAWQNGLGDRVTAMENSLIQAVGLDLAQPHLLKVDLVLPMNELTGEPYQCHNREWQGATYTAKPRDKTYLKKDHFSVPFKEKSSCGEIEAEGRHYFVYWEFPLLGGESLKFSKSAKASSKTDDAKFDEDLAALFSSDSTDGGA